MGTELARQERLASIAKDFHSVAEDLTFWCNSKADYLKHEEDATTVIAVQIQLDLMASFATERDATKAKLEQLHSLYKELSADNYHEISVVMQKLEETVTLWDSLKPLEDSKMAILKEAEQKETAKESLRLEYAKQSRDFDRWLRDIIIKVEKYSFGSSLAQVQAYRAEKDADDVKLKEEAQAKKSSLYSLSHRMTESGVKDNVHTLLTDADIDNFVHMLDSALEKRTQAFENELSRQEAMEATRIKFADAVHAFIESVDAITAKLESLSGEPEQKSEEIHRIYNSGEDQKNLLHACEEVDLVAKQLKIMDNKHTPHTIHSLRAKMQKLDAFVANLLASMEQEKIMKQRKLEREAEWAEKEKTESERNLYENKAQGLSQWLDNASELIGHTPKVSSCKEVQDLQVQLDGIVSEQPSQLAVFQELEDLNSKLRSKNVIVKHERLVENWEKCIAAIEKRKQWLPLEQQRQKEFQTIREEFATQANAFNA